MFKLWGRGHCYFGEKMYLRKVTKGTKENLREIDGLNPSTICRSYGVNRMNGVDWIFVCEVGMSCQRYNG